MTKPKDNLLAVSGLRTWFELRKWGLFHVGRIRAVDGVSFDLKHGETVAIVGESGCGKSTLARTILRLFKPVGGTINFKGHDIAGFSGSRLKHYRSKVGYVQQDPYGALPSFMDVQRILEEPMKIHGIKGRVRRRRIIEDTLSELNLTPAGEFLPKFPHMLSGGQQQRVVIARARIMHPDLIVADEPVSMLDASVRINILQLLKSVQKEHGVGLIYVTHDLSTVRYFSDRTLVMYAGRIVEQAGVEEILRNPFHPYTRALINAIPDPDAENAKSLRDLPPGEPPSLADPPAGCRFHPRCRHAVEGLCNRELPEDFEPVSGHKVQCLMYGQDARDFSPGEKT